MAEQKVSIIIPYYDKWPRFKYLLESLRNQSSNEIDYEIIVIDDGSKQALEALVGDRMDDFCGRLVIHRTMNRGRAAARNAGAQLAGGNLLLFVDDDMIVPPDFIAKHVIIHSSLAEEHFVHGKIYDLIQFTAVLDPETGERFPFLPEQKHRGPLLSFQHVFDHWHQFVQNNRRLSRLEKLIERALAEPALSSFHWIGCVGGNLSVSKDVFLTAGRFDEQFRVWGGEDFELGYRLNKQGVKAYYQRDLDVFHITHAHRIFKEELEESLTYFMNKHKDVNISHLYRFLQKKVDEEHIIQLWKRVNWVGENQAEACT